MTSYTKTLLLFFTALLLVASASPVLAVPEDRPAKALEIVYPTLQGGLELDAEDGLPQYIQYFFRFALAIVGFIILFKMVNGGLDYVLSAGNAEKMLGAKQGITSAFVGALVLVGAVILFNAINPSITKLSVDDITPITPVIQAGVYLCNSYSPEMTKQILAYTAKNTTLEKRIEAVEKIRQIIEDHKCYRVNYSANLDTSDLDVRKDRGGMFVIPTKVKDDNPETTDKNELDFEYDYGIVFHEKNNWEGKCTFRDPYNTLSVHSFSFLDFKQVKSVTLFKKPVVNTSSSNAKVILYSCLGYNEGQCPDDKQLKTPFGPGDNEWFKKYTGIKKAFDDKNTLLGLYENTRSISINPVGGYFAILYSEDEYKGDTCEVISKNDNNLLDQPIGRCDPPWYKGKCGAVLYDNQPDLVEYCLPCLKSMIVVKGTVIY